MINFYYHIKRKRLFSRALLVLVALGWLVSPAAAKTVRIDEARVQLVVAPGETKSGQINVTNPTDTPIQLRVYTEDWNYVAGNPNGDKEFFPPGTLPRSSSTWITYNPAEFEIPAFGTMPLNYTVTVPAGLSEPGTFYSILFFETQLGVTQDETGASVLVAGRVGSLMYVDVPGTVQRSGKIDSMEIVPGKGNKPTVIRHTFSNTGNTIIPLKAEFVVFDAEGLVKGRGELKDAYTREGMTVSQESEWPVRLEAGTYDFVFTYDLGENELIVEERQVLIE